MSKFRVKPGYGPHIIGEKKHFAGQVFESEKDLHLLNPKRFELVLEDGVVSTAKSVWGTEITPEIELASKVKNLRVYLSGRRYRLVLEGKPVTTDPTRLKTQKEVDAAIKKLIAEQKGEAALDESELEDEDEEETSTDETEETEEAEGEDDGIVGKPKKKKTKKTE